MSNSSHAEARIAIFADDLTGACDAAVAFAQRDFKTSVLLDGSTEDSDVEAWAVSTETRDVSEDVAVKTMHALGAKQWKAQEIFKKVDSVFRGNTFVEIRAAVESFSHDIAILSPAYPKLGRTVCGGVLTVDAAGRETIDLHARLVQAGISAHILSAGGLVSEIVVELQRYLSQGIRLVLCDALSADDLERTVAAAKMLKRRVLWIGSGGLAHALAQSMTDEAPHSLQLPQKSGIVILFVGSDHPVTQAQVKELQERARCVEMDVAAFERVSEERQIYVLHIGRGRTQDAEILRAVSVLRKDDIACVFLTGGDTAMQVCRALGVRLLQLQQEFTPGLPQGVFAGGELDGVSVVLKSGGFGEADVLCRLVERFANKRECM